MYIPPLFLHLWYIDNYVSIHNKTDHNVLDNGLNAEAKGSMVIRIHEDVYYYCTDMAFYR